MSATHRIPVLALRHYLYTRIEAAGPQGVHRAGLIRLASRQGYTAAEARYQLHKLGEAGLVEHVTHPLEVRIRAVREVAE